MDTHLRFPSTLCVPEATPWAPQGGCKMPTRPTRPRLSASQELSSIAALGLGMGREAGSTFSGKLPVRTKVLQGKTSGPRYLVRKETCCCLKGKGCLPRENLSKCEPMSARPRSEESQREQSQEQRRCANCPVWTSGAVCASSLLSLSNGRPEETTPHHPTLARSF